MSSLVKTMEWCNSADSSSIVGRGYLCGIMALLTDFRSTHSRTSPDFRHATTMFDIQGDESIVSIIPSSCKRFNSRDTLSRTENGRRRNFRVNLGTVNKLGNFPKPVNTDVGLYTLSFTVIFVTDAGRSKTLPYVA